MQATREGRGAAKMAVRHKGRRARRTRGKTGRGIGSKGIVTGDQGAATGRIFVVFTGGRARRLTAWRGHKRHQGGAGQLCARQVGMNKRGGRVRKAECQAAEQSGRWRETERQDRARGEVAAAGCHVGWGSLRKSKRGVARLVGRWRGLAHVQCRPPRPAERPAAAHGCAAARWHGIDSYCTGAAACC